MFKDHISKFISTNFDHINRAVASMLDDLLEHDTPESFEALSAFTAFSFSTKEPSKGMFRLVREWFANNTLEHALLTNKIIRAGINPDSAIQASKSFNGQLHVEGIHKLRIKDVKMLLASYPEQRVSKLLWSTDGEFIYDTFCMIDRIHSANAQLAYFPKKPKSIYEIHQKCLLTLPKIGQQDFELEQREDVVQLDGKKLNNDLIIRVPHKHFDLIDLGEALGFCIGNGSYSRMVKEKKSSIVGIFDKKGARYGIQFSRYRILEAQGFGNHRDNKPSPELLKELQILLTARPSMPTDFLPIVDSRWVHGYRYNDKDLYLLLNDIVYIYFNVDHDTYEELLESEAKGRFVNTHIKNNFSYERLGHIDQIEHQEAVA